MSETTPKERFTLYDKVVNPLAPYAIPLLSAIGPTLQPVYQYFDGEAKETESPSNSYIPVVVWSSRTVTSSRDSMIFSRNCLTSMHDVEHFGRRPEIALPTHFREHVANLS